MIHKRLVGVITVKQGWAVQSIGYKRHLPLGRPEVVAENLDRWGVDEILLQCIDRSRHGLGPDLALLERISRKGLATPLTYQGGIRSVADGVAVVQAGAERIALDSLLRDDPQQAAELAVPLGAQALIAAVPVSRGNSGDSGDSGDSGALHWLDHRNGRAAPLSADVLAVLHSGAFSELLLIDWRNEGRPGGFDAGLLAMDLPRLPLIVFGGLSEAAQLRQVFGHPAVAAAGVGNSLAWREHAVQALKTQLRGLPLRPPVYAGACAF